MLLGGCLALAAVAGCSDKTDSVEPTAPPPASTCLDESQEDSTVPCPENPDATDSQGVAEPQTVESFTIGKNVYLTRCVGCHGVDGVGIVGPDIRPGKVLEKYASAEAMEALVRDGIGEMPEFGSRLRDEEIVAVVGYVRGGLG